MIKKALIVLLLILNLMPTNLLASDRQSDDRSYQRRYFNEAALKEYYRDKDFFYLAEAPPSTLLDRLINWLSELLERIFRDASGENITSTIRLIFRILFWLIGSGAMVLLFYFLFKHGSFALFTRKNVAENPGYRQLEDQVTTTDWLALIQEQIGQKRYKMAVRMLYLYTIQQLNLKGLIAFKPDKTNSQYTRELHDPVLREHFSGLTRYYDFIWFGDFVVDESAFNKIYRMFNQFNKAQ